MPMPIAHCHQLTLSYAMLPLNLAQIVALPAIHSSAHVDHATLPLPCLASLLPALLYLLLTLTALLLRDSIASNWLSLPAVELADQPDRGL